MNRNMNKKEDRKISSNLSIILLIIILGLSYLYMNLPDNFNIQMGGASGPPPVPAECLPFRYKFRYLFYFFLIFMIFLTIKEYMVYEQYSKYTYTNYMTTFLQLYATNTEAIKNKTISPKDKEAYYDLIKVFSGLNQYSKYGEAFCGIASPCNCCNEPGYYNSGCPSGSPGSIKPAGTPSITPSKTPSK